MQKLAACIVALACLQAAMAQTPVPRPMTGAFPCSSFRKEKDGAWTQVKPITVLNVSVTGASYEKGSKEALSLDRRCGS